MGDSDFAASDCLSNDSIVYSVFEEELDLMGDSDYATSDCLSNDSIFYFVFEEELDLMGDFDSTASDCLSNDSVVYSLFKDELDLMGISASSGYLSDDSLVGDSAAYDYQFKEFALASSAYYYSSSDTVATERRMPRREGCHRKHSKAKKRVFYGFG